MDENVTRGIPFAHARRPEAPGRLTGTPARIRIAAGLPEGADADAVAPALLALLRKYSGNPTAEIDYAGRGPLRVTMAPERTLGAHADAVADAIRRVAGPVGGTGIALFTGPAPAETPGTPTAETPDPPTAGPGEPGAPAGDAGSTAGYELVLRVAHGDAGPTLHLDADAGVLDRADAARIRGHLLHLIRLLRTAPELRLDEVDLLKAAERKQIDAWSTGTARPYPRDSAIYPLFAEQVAARPDAPAVVHGDTVLTYRELDARATELAAALAAHGVVPGDRVGLMFGKVPEWVVATLAVLRAGAAYVPVDPDFPADRREFILADSGSRVLVTADMVDARTTAAAPDVATRATDGAYVMYTSGTTGRPKGVLINQRAVVRLVKNSTFATLNADTRILQTGAIGFDAATFELWGALLNGGTLVLVPESTILDAAKLGHAIGHHGITCMWLTAPLFHQLVDQDATAFRGLAEVLVGGDVLSHPHIARAMRACPGLRVINGYGPTENTTFSATHLITAPPVERIPIGTPVTNSTAFVLDCDGRPQPVGVPGELLVGGDGLSDGYLNRPELEAERFVTHGNGRLYRTGDLVAWRPDGTLDFLGRVDQQVKIRGFRVEPGEVENHLIALPYIREAAVLARTRPDGVEKYLCAYVTAERNLAPGEVAGALRARVPAYLVPAVVVQVPAMPLNRNGKVDRGVLAALPETGPQARTDLVAPRDEVERALADLWERVLGDTAVGVTDDIVELGVTSLTAAVFAARAQHRFGAWLDTAEVLTHRTVEALARRIDGHTGEDEAAPALTPAPHRALYPITPQQHGIYVEQVKDPGATHYNIPVLVETSAPIDAGRLQHAVDVLVERHESLRTTFVHLSGTTYQRVHDAMPVPVEELPAALRDFVRPFDLVEGPLLRVGRRGGRLMLDVHHIVADGVAVDVLLDELSTAYDGGALDPVAVRYRDYAVWRVEAADAWIERHQKPFWARDFAAVRPDLPTDLPRPPLRGTAGARWEFDVGAGRTAALSELARRSGATPFHALASVHALFLAEATGGDEVSFGTPAGGRTLPGTERVVGMFANTLCLSVPIVPAEPFTELVRRAGEQVLGALRNQDHPFDRLVQESNAPRDYSRNPLFDAMLGFQDTSATDARQVLGGHARALDSANRHTMFDLNLQIYDDGGSWRGVWAYRTDLFLDDTVRAFADRLLALIDAVVAAPDTPVGELIGRTRVFATTVPIDFDFAHES
ncbi:hypothetical protein Val02_52540 [Virgisporangium aliadipatigenens]|uniref:Carrier domain-containing protein n=1 Tax=Virgisporangium aliadipatigenens TaxID=741659 RepID=A0A8J3YRD7_9ACTN|nr:non-ribosomal peptide synthetase [Virgisporangium aliadipatigenens]GIJ48368.1 hypothetical protein Val02_52540 [Virgisporangium aliadipatigenens]